MRVARNFGIVALLSAGLLGGSARGAEPDRDAFPLMAWSMLSDMPEGANRAEQFRWMREAGLTHAGLVLDKADLPLLAAEGLQAYFFDRRVLVPHDRHEPLPEDEARARVQAVLDELAGLPGVAGLCLMDEPFGQNLVPLAQMARLVRELDPGRWGYVNLLPNYAGPWMLDHLPYERYLDKYVELCEPEILCVDNYMLLRTAEERPLFYRNMQLMRDAARRRGVPFWSVACSLAHYAYPAATEANLSLQVFAALAYGARGLGYFTYFDLANENTRAAPVDRFGHRTATWYMIRELNHRVRALAPTLNRLAVGRNYFLGAVPQGGETPPADAWIALRGGVPEGAGVLVGEFAHEDGSRYLMLVNLDEKNSLDIAFAAPGAERVGWVSDAHGRVVHDVRKAGDGWGRWLAPATGQLFRLE